MHCYGILIFPTIQEVFLSMNTPCVTLYIASVVGFECTVLTFELLPLSMHLSRVAQGMDLYPVSGVMALYPASGMRLVFTVLAFPFQQLPISMLHSHVIIEFVYVRVGKRTVLTLEAMGLPQVSI